MKPEPSTRKTWSSRLSAPDFAAGFAAAALAAGAGFLAAGFSGEDLDLLGVGMARMWAVGRPESMRNGLAVNHSAGCSTGPRAGLSLAQAGRSNRKRSGVPRTTQYQTSAPITPAVVTISETVPRSGMMPVLSSTARVVAIGRKNAR